MKVLLHNNIASHYRSAIYKMMDKEFGCDFCFGDKMMDIKKMDYSLLTGSVTEVHNLFFPYFYYQKGMMKLLKRNYDTYIICTETHCISSWLFLIFRKVFYPHKRVYAWTHGVLCEERGIKLALYKFQYSLLTGAFIYNERSRGIMIKKGIPADKLTTIYNSLDYDKQLNLRESLQEKPIYEAHFGNQNKNIVFIGRLTKVKRFDLLIDAIALLKERDELVNITFIGDGIERHNMEVMVKEKGLNNLIWFYGASYDEKSNAELIYNADLCVSPGNIGLTAMHVLMFGCPAITNDDFNNQMPEFEAIQKGKSGAFFKAGDSTSLADTIHEWFSIHGKNRNLVRKACYEVIDSKWNPHHQIEIMKSVLLSNY